MRVKILREVALVGLGALSLLRERLETMKEEFKKRGEEALSELKGRKELFKAKGEEERERLRGGLRKLVSLHPLFASKLELEELRRRVEALEGRVPPPEEE